MAHQHDHDHAHHQAGADNERRVLLALALTGSFMVIEVVGGIASGSLALIADAGHMLTDTLSLGLAYLAFRIGRWPRDSRRTYGYHRFQVLAAFVNGLTLVGVVGWIGFEAIRRLFEPVEVLGGLMLTVAVMGLLVTPTSGAPSSKPRSLSPPQLLSVWPSAPPLRGCSVLIGE
ncbi:MAG: cation diffusion facilitator family transporter [Pseudomonadota bacterium]